MAKIKGTNGNDTITGTADDDTIVPLLGQDQVNGGAGYDTLVVDYSSLTDVYWFSNLQFQTDATWSGGLVGGPNDAANFVTFDYVERVVFTATQADDYLTLDLGTSAPLKSRLSLDGFSGNDTLSVVAGDLSKALSLVTASDGTVKSNFAVLAGWENYTIGLGTAAGNYLVLGEGNDTVGSTGGTDTIDFGAGQDGWTGYYQDRSDDLEFFWNAPANFAAVYAPGVKIADLKNVESVSFQGGSGDDAVTVTGGAGFLSGGEGDDQLDLTKSPNGDQLTTTLTVEGTGLIAGQASAVSDEAVLNFRSFETMTLTGSTGDDEFVLDASATLLSDVGYGIEIAGRAGYDGLELDLQAQGQAYLASSTEGAGFGTADFVGTANHLHWRDIEGLTVKFGAGNDRVDFGVASDILNVDGGAGFDTVDFVGAAGGITLFLDQTTPQTVDGRSVSLKNVEGVVGSNYADLLVDSAAGERIQGGAGDDSIYSSAASTGGPDVFEGGSGSDLMTYQDAAGSVYVSLAVTTAQNTGAAGTDTLSGFETLVGSGYNDILTGSSSNDALGGYFGDDVLEGLGGNDLLDGGNGFDTARYTNAAAAVTVSLAITTAQNTGGAGTDTLVSIENLVGSAFADTLGGYAGTNRLSGGRGADTLTGGSGADVFSYSSVLDSTASAYDRITDFSHSAGDKISLQAVDAVASTPRLNDAFTFIGSDAFHGVAGELREVAARGGGYFLYGDTNGDKAADLAIFVQSSTSLVAGDIVL